MYPGMYYVKNDRNVRDLYGLSDFTHYRKKSAFLSFFLKSEVEPSIMLGVAQDTKELLLGNEATG